MARYSEAEAYAYYVVRHKETGQYLRGSHGNDWGDYYNGATIYRQKKRAENVAKVAEMQGNPAEVVEIQIFENTDVVPRVEFAREIFEEIERLLDNHHSACLPIGAIEAYVYYDGGLGDAISELKKKYTEDQT